MDGAGSHVEAEMGAKEPRDFLVGVSLAPEFADEFAVWFQFGAEGFGGKVIEEATNMLIHEKVREPIRGYSSKIRVFFEKIRGSEGVYLE